MDFTDKANSLAKKMNELTEKFNLSEEMVLEGEDIIEDVKKKTDIIDLKTSTIKTDLTIEPEFNSSLVLELVNLQAMVEDFQYIRETLKETTDNGRRVLEKVTIDLLDSEDEQRASLIMSFAELNSAVGKNMSLYMDSYKQISNVLVNLDKIIKNTNGSGKVHYSYTNPALIKTIDYSKNPKFSESLLEFTLTSDTFKQLQKAAAMFGVQNIVIKSSDNNNIELITTTVDKNKKDTDNLFSVEVPSEKYSKDIAVAVDKDILKLYNGDYKVIVYPVNAKQSMLYFKNISVSNTLEYIASAKIV